MKLGASILLGFALALPACAGVAATKQKDPKTPVQDLLALERKTLDAVNDTREKAGLPRLVNTEELARVARAHSAYQARTGRAGHVGEAGSNPADRARAAGIAYRVIAENVAMNQGYADPVGVALDGWMKSSGHRKNILNSLFTRTGVGVAVGLDGEVYFTQMFLDPASAQ